MDLIIGQGATSPALTATMTDQSGNPVNLSGCTVTFVMRSLFSSTPVVNTTATITNAAAGTVQYSWLATDTATSGLYSGQFQVVTGSGTTFSAPTDGYLEISIEDSLALANVTELVDVSDAKDYLNIQSTDRTRDAKILRFIKGVRPLIEAITGPIVPTQYDEWYDGGQVSITLRHRPNTGYGTSPLLILQAISEYNGPIEWPLSIISSPDQGQLYSAQVDLPLGRVVRRTAGGGVQAFPGLPQSVHVVYTAGQYSVPWNVQEATLEYLREQFQDTQQGLGLRNQAAIADDEISTRGFVGFALSGRVTQMLAPTRRAPSVA